MKINKLIKGIMLVMLLTFLMFPMSYSASNEAYSVTPVLTELQDEATEHYVHINTDKEISREFEYKITNRSTADLTLEVTALNALTSPNGVIQYIEGTEEDNSILTDEKYSFSKYVEKMDDIIIPKQESKIIKVKVDIPLMEGQILGGIGFSSITGGETVVEGESQFKINNEVKTVVAFLADFGGVDKATLEFGEPFINPMPSYYAIRLPIELKSPTILESPVIKYEVTDEEENSIFKSYEDKPLNFSPKSKINYVIPWDNEKITKDKKYTIRGSISYILNDERFVDEFEKQFTLTGEESVYGESLVGEIVVEETRGVWYYVAIGSIVLLILVLLLLVIKKVISENRKKTNGNQEYVIFCNSSTPKKIITSSDEYLYDAMQHVSEAENDNNLKFALIFSKEFDKNLNEDVFVFKESLELTE